MMCSAASVAAEAHSLQQLNALPRRPFTACAGLQPVALVKLGDGSRSNAYDDSDSDGASFDDDEEAGAVVNILTLDTSTNVGSGNDAPTVLEELLTDSERLLLGGKLWGISSSPKPATCGQPKKTTSATIGTTCAPPSHQQKCHQTTIQVPIIKAESLPKQCLFLGSQSSVYSNGSKLCRQKMKGNRAGMSSVQHGALAPGAARVQSHISWMTFRPVRDTRINQGAHGARSAAAAVASAAAAAGSSGTATSSLSGQHIVTSDLAPSQPSEAITSHETGDMAAPTVPTVEAQPSQSVPVATDGPTPVPRECAAATTEVPRKKGPKYRVVPGGSRPANVASIASKQAAPKAGPSGGQGFLVVEFRTEPRVVPAARHSHRDRRGSGGHARHQFRPGSRQWASERQALAAAAQ